MNEKFAIEPSACRNSMEWRYLLEKFGPFSGRYGIKFPDNWQERLLKQVESQRWHEAEKVKILLRRADEEKALLDGKHRSRYVESKEWIENLEADPEAKVHLTNVILRKRRQDNQIDLDSLNFPPTAGERVPSDVNSFLRVSEVLLTIGPELYFVDPFLNVLRSDYGDVLIGMLRVASKGACTKIEAWCSERKVDADEREILSRITDIKKQSGFTRFPIHLHLVDDSSSQYKLHDRWLFTQYGGIGFSQGFQRQSRNRAMNVWPMDRKHLEDCWTNLREGNADFTVRQIVC
jgi:hypothetical protein